MINLHFSGLRLWAMIIKEFVQMRRDRLTFGMMIGIPLIQLILFGFAINSNPRNLPAVVISADDSVLTRAFLSGVKNTGYFALSTGNITEQAAYDMLAQGKTQFVIHIPPLFSRQLVRGDKPPILIEADATDSVATSNAIAALTGLTTTVFNPYLTGNLASLQATAPPATLIIHAKYNPEQITQYDIVPGLLGVVLTMTMVVITSLAITRERERGTMENLLATPVRPLEVMLGKITPYVVVGYIQVTLILLAAYYLFHVPFHGSILLLLVACLPFIAANLSVGLTFSTLAENQLQAMQLSFFFFLPSILLSGFMFPFRGMPVWAQWLGSFLPLTHFINIVRGILLKGNNCMDIMPNVWPIMLFVLVVLSISLMRYRQTLD